MIILKYKKIQDVSFTTYNFLTFSICYLYNFELNNLYAICCCCSWGILTSFHSIIYFDRNAFNKMTKKLETNIFMFHFGNYVLHIYPCYITCIYRPQYLKLYHGIISMILHLFWIYLISNKTWSLNNVYIKQPQKIWNKLYIISSATELLTPCIYYALNSYINKSII